MHNEVWKTLEEHREQVAQLRMRDLFAEDDDRASRFSITDAGIHLDFSKNLITDETVDRLVDLAKAAGVPEWIDRMFAGEAINNTENRAVLHTALRNRSSTRVMIGDEDIMPAVLDVLERMGRFALDVRSGSWKGYSGKVITDVVNIGIGGSHLGPKLVCDALRPYQSRNLKVHFVSNVDGTDIHETICDLDPETTLFIVASKTFTTLETMTNAHTARKWFLKHASDPAFVSQHFVAVSTNTEQVEAFGIPADQMFGFWDWVGGRYSLWSAIGLPIILAVGMDRFTALLEGAHEMDRHFQRTDLRNNIPVMLALMGVWNRNFLNHRTQAVVPYDQYLERLPEYLQQLDMESNGKHVDRDGQPLQVASGPVLWGSIGTNGQHAYFQLLHQGSDVIPVDFILPVKSHFSVGDHHRLLAANCFAQSEALMRGKTLTEAQAELRQEGQPEDEVERLAPHKEFAGNRPSNTILIDQLSPSTLGAILAMYEHKVFVQGIIWNLNSFDQWGVELGKQLAGVISDEMHQGEVQPGQHDGSTSGLIEKFIRQSID